MDEVAFLYNTPHPAHRAFAEAVDADFYPLIPGDTSPAGAVARLRGYVRGALSYPADYDYYLVEGGRGLIPGLLFSMRHRDATVILLNADETFLNVEHRLGHYTAAETLAHRASLGAVDGLVNVGEMVGEYAERAGLRVPSETVYPPISDEWYGSLEALDVGVGSERVVAVGEHKPAVGFDILVDAVRSLREEGSDVELHLAGPNHPEEWNRIDGVTVHGWVEDLPAFVARGEVSAHPGRSECFPVSTLEPMLGGRPTVVSERVGTKEVVRPIADELVIPEPTVPDTVDALRWYFDRPPSEREALAREARRAARRFSERRCAEEFAAAFGRLVGRL
jgi:glycosyltransferase involved in cell wall biosynthesis